MVRAENTEPGLRSAGKSVREPEAAELHPMIRSGDALIVAEHTAVVDARLEATSLGPAVAGAEFPARLRIGGKVVRVIALAPGRAELAPEQKAQP